MPQWSSPSSSRWVWPLVGLLAAVLSVVEAATDDEFEYPVQTSLPGVAVGVLLAVCPRFPVLAAVLGAASVLGNFAQGVPGPGGAQLIGMAVLVGHASAVLPGRRGAWTAAGSSLLVVASGVAFSSSRWEGVFYLLVAGVGWAVGALVRQVQQRSQQMQLLAARLAEQQEAVASAAAVAERARIAREVHDSVAHSVSVMVLQMGGLRRLLPDRPDAQEVLRGLERLGRESVDEMRRVVGILREGTGGAAGADPAPQPSLSRLDGVLDELRRTGMPVELGVTGEPAELPHLVDVSAVRVVQEALSNVVRHAGAAATRVELAWAADRVTVSVTDDGRPRVTAPADATAPGGHGQLHMRERVAVAGGTLAVGPVRGGGYRVRASFPVPAGAPASAAAPAPGPAGSEVAA